MIKLLVTMIIINNKDTIPVRLPIGLAAGDPGPINKEGEDSDN